MKYFGNYEMRETSLFWGSSLCTNWKWNSHICHYTTDNTLDFRLGSRYLGGSFTTSLNYKVVMWWGWGFIRLIAPAAVPVHVGVDSLKKPHHIGPDRLCLL